MSASDATQLEQAERIAALEEHNEILRRDRAEAIADRDAWRDAHLPDPEAECLAGCVRAIAAMLDGNRRSNIANYEMHYGPRMQELRSPALGHPIGRILLALAARYDLAIVAEPPRQRVGDDTTVVPVPAALFDQVQEMVRTWERTR